MPISDQLKQAFIKKYSDLNVYLDNLMLDKVVKHLHLDEQLSEAVGQQRKYGGLVKNKKKVFPSSIVGHDPKTEVAFDAESFENTLKTQKAEAEKVNSTRVVDFALFDEPREHYTRLSVIIDPGDKKVAIENPDTLYNRDNKNSDLQKAIREVVNGVFSSQYRIETRFDDQYTEAPVRQIDNMCVDEVLRDLLNLHLSAGHNVREKYAAIFGGSPNDRRKAVLNLIADSFDANDEDNFKANFLIEDNSVPPKFSRQQKKSPASRAKPTDQLNANASPSTEKPQPSVSNVITTAPESKVVNYDQLQDLSHKTKHLEENGKMFCADLTAKWQKEQTKIEVSDVFVDGNTSHTYLKVTCGPGSETKEKNIRLTRTFDPSNNHVKHEATPGLSWLKQSQIFAINAIASVTDKSVFRLTQVTPFEDAEHHDFANQLKSHSGSAQLNNAEKVCVIAFLARLNDDGVLQYKGMTFEKSENTNAIKAMEAAVDPKLVSSANAASSLFGNKQPQVNTNQQPENARSQVPPEIAELLKKQNGPGGS